MTILAIPLAIVGALLIRGPVVEESAIEQVHEGMAKREVRRILGSPHIRGDDDICWYYYYREDQAVAGEPATIQFDGHNRVHAIYR